MTAPPLVSVVTPTLNRARCLPGLLASVRNQSYANLEHIIVDGGSTDGTMEILQNEERRGDVRWISQPDRGVYEAVNKGMRLAQGEIVAYLNSDDRYFSYSVAVATEALGRDPSIGFVYGDVFRFNEETSSGRVVFYPPFDAGALHRGALISQPTVFWRRELMETAGSFDTRFPLAADIEYWNRLARVVAGLHLNEVLAFEGEHQSRLTSGSQAERQAMDELRLVQSEYRVDVADHLSIRVYDRVRAGFWHRSAALSFMWALSHSRFGQPGQRWQGFLQEASAFRVSRRGLLRALVPYVGRTRRDFVTASEIPPTLRLDSSPS